MIRTIFVGEETSDRPLAQIVQRLFIQEGVDLDITSPEFERLPSRVAQDVGSKIKASLALTQNAIDLFIIHRDADASDSSARRSEIAEAVNVVTAVNHYLPIVPIRMTEAWLLLDEHSIRRVAGNPNGRMPLGLPSAREVERRSDPKTLLADALVTASGATGRRRDGLKKRFNEHRRRLLESLDIDGVVNQLQAWQELREDVASTARMLERSN